MISRRVLAFVFICTAWTAPLVGQRHYSYVSGIITDASGATVPGALISVFNEDTGFRRTALTQLDGNYLVSSLEAGSYKITVRKEGFHTMIRFGVRLAESQPLQVDFKLVVGSVQETITVEGAAPLLTSDDAVVATIIGRDEIDRLPVRGAGGLLPLFELTPGLIVTPATRGEAGQFTVNGQRPNTNYFIVDGASANSSVGAGGLPAQSNGGSLPAMTAFGSLDNLVSLDALDEVRVATSTTTPEFGRLPGAQISLTSRSGSNELHGSLLYAFRNDALAANDWFANSQGLARAPQHFYDFAATLGGPLRRNRTFFFVSYEGMRLLQPSTVRQPVPSLQGRTSAPTWVQPLLNLFPAPNGPDLGAGLAQWTGGSSRPARADVGSVRIDQAITSHISAFARYSDTPSSNEFGNNSVDFIDLHSRTVTGGLTYRVANRLTLDFRANYSQAFSDSSWMGAPPAALPQCYAQLLITTLFPADACSALVRVSIAGVGDVTYGSEGQRNQSQTQASETSTLNIGAHTIQFGADYRRLAPVRRDAGDTISVIANSLQDFVQFGDLWKANSPLQSTSGQMDEISLFIADIWRATPRFTVNYGLRLEISPSPVPNAPVNFVDPANGTVAFVQQPLWNSTLYNLAPRIGAAYRLNRSGRTVLRAGGGFFYDSSLSLANDLVNNGPFNVSSFSSLPSIFAMTLQYGFLRNLQLPLVRQWNAGIEQALTQHDVLFVNYAGSAGSNLIRREIGGPGTTSRDWLALATNHGVSTYYSLNVQYQRRLSGGVQALVSYAWSHSIDNSSTDAGLYWVGSGVTANSDRASSDFDIRHSVSGGFTYETPARSAVLRRWALDGLVRARTGFPINVLDIEQFTGVNFENIFRPNLLPGQPVWISDTNSGGGRRLNVAAFQVVTDSQGNLGRNALNGFGMWQLDLAARREFVWSEHRSLQLRIEAFNLFNHPNFADPSRYLSSPLFGQSPSMLNVMLGTGSPASGLSPLLQAGGARSLQVTARFRF